MKTIPTISQLYTAIKSDIEAQLGVNIPILGKNITRVLSGVQAVKLKMIYLVLGFVQKNLAPDTADPASSGGTLERFGEIRLGRQPFPAVAAQYVLTVTGAIGATIKAQTTFKSDDDSLNPGLLFILDNAYVLVATTDTITVRALTVGVESQLNILDKLTATAPIALVSSAAVVASQAVEPKAAEDINDYRAKIVQSYRLEPQGGAPSDYYIWCADAQGVKRVYPYNKSGTADAEINLYVEATIADSTDGKGTPSAQLLLDVEAVVETSPDTTIEPAAERGRRPMGIKIIHFLEITPRDVDIIIADFDGLDAEIEALLLQAITNTVNAVRPFVSGADVLADKNDIIDRNKITGSIMAQKPGAIYSALTIMVDGVVYPSFQFLDGDIPFLNSVTYV